MAGRNTAIAVLCLLLASCEAEDREYDYDGEREVLFPLGTDEGAMTKMISETASWARVSVPGGLPLGATAKKNELFIWKNGVVTLGVETLSHTVAAPPTSLLAAQSEFLVAPLWFDQTGTEVVSTTVQYEEHSSSAGQTPSRLLRNATYTVGNFSARTFGTALDFLPTWALLVDWKVEVFADIGSFCGNFSNYTYDYELDFFCQYNSDFMPEFHYQLILATDGIDTFAAYTYECDYSFSSFFDFLGSTNQTGPDSLYGSVLIGYQTGETYKRNQCDDEDSLGSIFSCNYFNLRCDNFYVQSYPTIVYNLTDAFSIFRVISHLEEGLDYIPFLLIEDYAEEVLLMNGNSTSSGATYLPNRIYVTSNPIITSGIGIGSTIQTTLYVGTNGIISFGRPFYFFYPQLFPTRYPWTRYTYVAAPFWHGVDLRADGSVYYKVYRSTDEGVDYLFEYVNGFVQSQTNTSFTGTWMLVAAWDEVPVYPHYYVLRYGQYYSPSFREAIMTQRNSFEAIIISGGADTYAVYTYNCLELESPGAYSYAVIGYNLNGLQSENNPFSGSISAQRVACGNFPASNWFNLVYKLNTGEDEVLRAQQECRALLEQDKQTFSSYDIESLAAKESPCPCSIRNVWWDRNYRWDSDDFYCFYRRFPDSSEQFGQYCCYEFDFSSTTFGALVRSGQRVSGYAYLDRSKRPVLQDDRQLRDVCCGLAGLCDLYLERRPPNDCTGYVAPVWTWGWGDPHITTLDDFSYTFNGYGEYVLLSRGEFLVQSRMAPYPNTTATQFVAFSVGTVDEDHVEVDCSAPSPFCKVLLNGDDISSNLTSVNDTSTASTVEVVRESETTVSAVFANGAALAVVFNATVAIPSFTLTLPESFHGNTSGLLGNNDDDKTNDLVMSNGTMLPSNASDRAIHEFGGSWLIRNNDPSLFTYPDGMDSESYHDPTWEPSFISDILQTADQETLDRCTPAGSSQPLPQCVFDAVETGDINIGVATTDTNNENILANMESNNMPPVLNGDAVLRVNRSDPSPASLFINVTDEDTSVEVMLTSLPAGATLTRMSDLLYHFTWTLPSLEEDQELRPLQFYATDSLNAVGTFTPRLEVCACENEGECSLEGVANPSADVVIMTCICDPAWEGRYCQRDVDGCLEFSCQEGVECMDIPAPGQGAECGPCPPGYTGDGAICVDIDECARSNDTCAQVCANTEGSFECSCNSGYQVDPSDPNACIDVDECALLLDGCAQICTNTMGSFTCSCREGFSLASDQRACDADQGCSDDVCGDGAQCAMVGGSDTCFCPSGYDLTTDMNCTDIDECATASVCGQVCTNFIGGFACSCNDGYELELNRRTCRDIDECEETAARGTLLCSGDKVCLNIDGGYRCICPPGQYLDTMRAADGTTTTTCASPVVSEDFSQEKVTANISGVTERDLLERGRLDDFIDVVADAVGEYCGMAQCRIARTGTGRERRQTLTFDPTTDSLRVVVDVDSVTSTADGAALEFYVEVETSSGTTGVLDSSDTLAAASTAGFSSTLGGSVSFMVTFPPSPSPFPSLSPSPSPSPSPSTEPPTSEDEEGYSLAVVVGSAVGAAVVTIILSAMLALILYLCLTRGRDKVKPSHPPPSHGVKQTSAAMDRQGLLTEPGEELKAMEPPSSSSSSAGGPPEQTAIENVYAA